MNMYRKNVNKGISLPCKLIVHVVLFPLSRTTTLVAAMKIFYNGLVDRPVARRTRRSRVVFSVKFHLVHTFTILPARIHRQV